MTMRSKGAQPQNIKFRARYTLTPSDEMNLLARGYPPKAIDKLREMAAQGANVIHVTDRRETLVLSDEEPMKVLRDGL